MNKKANSILFMAIATVVNILLLLLFLVAGIVILSLLPFADNPNTYSIGILVVFFLSIILSFSIYSKLIKWATKKFDLENRLDPILTPRKNRRDNRE